jgi:hypothetical protein
MPSSTAGLSFHVRRIGRGRDGGQRRAAPIDQQMAFAARLAAVGRIGSGVSPTQRCRHGLAVDTLPAPGNAPALIVGSQLLASQALKNAKRDPFLEAFMAGAARAKRGGDGFPLAAGAQHIENTVADGPKGHGRASNATRGFFRRQ